MTRSRRGKRGRSSPNPPPLLSKRIRLREDGGGGLGGGGGGASSSSTSLVMVTGLPRGCTVLELKSGLEAYGAIARTRIDPAATAGFVTFRSAAAAQAAIAASLDPEFGITIGSKKVLVVWASEPSMHWKAGAQADPAQEPLHGRNYKKPSDATAIPSSKSASEEAYKGRKIVAYDDLF